MTKAGPHDRKPTVPATRSSDRQYRGIVLPRLAGQTRIPHKDLERAVAAAFAKHTPTIVED